MGATLENITSFALKSQRYRHLGLCRHVSLAEVQELPAKRQVVLRDTDCSGILTPPTACEVYVYAHWCGLADVASGSFYEKIKPGSASACYRSWTAILERSIIRTGEERVSTTMRQSCRVDRSAADQAWGVTVLGVADAAMKRPFYTRRVLLKRPPLSLAGEEGKWQQQWLCPC